MVIEVEVEGVVDLTDFLTGVVFWTGFCWLTGLVFCTLPAEAA